MPIKKWATVSTTRLVRQAGNRAGWDVAGAIHILDAWSSEHPNAKSAIRIKRERTAGASRFAIEERCGRIVGLVA